MNSLHLGYGGMLPVLKITNAYASEARFSNFEQTSSDDLLYAWQTSATGSTLAGTAARTGIMGLHVTAPMSLTTVLPTAAVGAQLPPAAPGIRVSFWTKATTATQLTVQLARTTTTPATVVFTKAVTAGGGTGTGVTAWRLVEVPILGLAGLGVTPTNHTDFTVSITNASTGQTLDIDDVLLVPSTATASSTTYEPMWGKTSETNEQGRTTYYDYSPSGRLRGVRDHQGNLVQQFQQVVNGHNADESVVDFVISSNNSASNQSVGYHSGDTFTFTPRGLCDETATYQWNFGCTGAGPCTSTVEKPTFQYPTTYSYTDYTVTLTVTTSYGTQVITKPLTLLPPVPHLSFGVCVDGSIRLDGCGSMAPPLACSSATPPATTTILRVNITGSLTPLYDWQIRLPNSTRPNDWISQSGGYASFNNFITNGSSTGSALEIPHTLNQTVEYRCVMSCNNGNQSWTETATSPNFLIVVQNRDGVGCN